MQRLISSSLFILVNKNAINKLHSKKISSKSFNVLFELVSKVEIQVVNQCDLYQNKDCNVSNPYPFNLRYFVEPALFYCHCYRKRYNYVEKQILQNLFVSFELVLFPKMIYIIVYIIQYLFVFQILLMKHHVYHNRELEIAQENHAEDSEDLESPERVFKKSSMCLFTISRIEKISISISKLCEQTNVDNRTYDVQK